MKDCSNLELKTTTEKEWILEESKKMPIGQRASDFFSKKYKKKIKVPKIYSCDKCGFESNLHQRYYKHVLYKHTGRQIQCDKCDKSFHTLQQLRCHIVQIHEPGKKLKCDLCDFTSAIKGSLKKHIDFVHKKIKNYSCDKCGKKFFETRELTRHYSYVHEGQKTYKCNLCDKSFATPHGLSGHIGKTRYHPFWIMHPTT